LGELMERRAIKQVSERQDHEPSSVKADDLMASR
jgi:hypothetical protein